MLQIVRLTLREIKLPLKEPFQISSGTMSARRIILVELEDASGATSWGECVADDAPNYLPDVVDSCWPMLVRWVAPRILGRRFGAPGEVHAQLEDGFRGHNMAKAAVEMGMWGVEAERLGIPLARLIGGTREYVDVGISLGIQATPEALVEKVRGALAQGYRKVKIKIGRGKDVDFVRAARQAFPDAPLMADANNAYTLDDIDTFVAMDDLGLMMFEQPLAWDDIVRHAELQKHLKTPICLDESITNLERAQDMVTLGSGRIINIKPGRVGGFSSSIAIHDFCESNGIPVWCGGMLESGIGRAYNIALASLPNFRKPGDISPSARYWARDIITPEWTMGADGTTRVPLDRPGLGVTVDRDRIDDLTVRVESLS
ncbi:MAG: o-succinylbenzoate synthase [Gemmatimonadetes bacterium]|nr:o-succinylbenzoate synthase [Gemmatimonadota bacterium]